MQQVVHIPKRKIVVNRIKSTGIRHILGKCPVCGSDKSFREPKDRYEYLQDTITYDNCMGY